jgi:hypothetical protein
MTSAIDMSDESWQVQKQAYRDRLATIIIPLDISPGIAKGLLSRIDSFFSEIRLELAETDGRKERIDNVVREWEREKADGRNEIERKQNATRAIQEYPLGDGTSTNLYEVQRQMTERASFLQGVLDVLYGKQSRLITITGVLKLERDLSPHSEH